MAIQVVILAAGQGKRMRSNLPKVLHPLAGKPILEHVLNTAFNIAHAKSPIIVFGHQGDRLKALLPNFPVSWVLQKEQLGTGHALLQAMPHIDEDDQVLVLAGDVPLITAETLLRLIDCTAVNEVGLISANVEEPRGYGRIKRHAKGQVIGIVEEKDADQHERMITEINAGIYLIPKAYLKKWLLRLRQKNAQNEYYLTDIISFAVEDHVAIRTVAPKWNEEIFGINDKLQLALLERFYQRQCAEKWLKQGVTLMDPARLDIRGEVEMGLEVTIDVNVILEGRVVIGNECVIGANVILRNVELGDKTIIQPNSMIEDSIVKGNCRIGPFARIRPRTIIEESAHIGNFVEIKNSEIGMGSKVNHLSYVGDSTLGKSVNIGAGTITCNYDGVYKHKTTIGDGAFIGSCTQLVAPVTVGEKATIGAGSTITKDVPPHKLTLSRVPQKTIDDWVRKPVEK